MSRYELYLFLHVVAAIAWLGSGLLLQVLAARAERRHDEEGLRRVAADSDALSTTLFIPSSLAVLVLGLLMVFDGPWGFDSLWVSLGLAGYLATFLTGVLVMKPGSEHISALFERDGGRMTPESSLAIRKLLAKGRVDTLVLYLVVAVMVLKPTGDDVGLLAVMAALVVGGLAATALRLRTLDAEAGGAGLAQPSSSAA